MASRRAARRAVRERGPAGWRRSVWASAGLLYLGGALQLAAPLPAVAQTALPTPCGGVCGTSGVPTAFVTAGQASLPTVNGQTMTVTQQSDRAILNWADFNIASDHRVTFVQPSTTAQALNRIWSGDPSVIAGRLDANGQVMLLNQNGIVFDRGAQVNVGALTASTLNITDERFQAGLLSGNPASTRVFGDGTVKTGEVEVRAGAQLAAASGGRIMLLGSRVTNAGSITTPDGQTILAAGKSVYLAASTDPALRGLLIEVDSSTVDAGTGLPGAPDPGSSTVTNTGQVSAPRGNITVAGLIVNQAGRLSATTSVSQNGSIYLLAGDTSSSATEQFFGAVDARDTMLPNHGGTLTLAAGSVTEVLADPTDTGTISTQNEAQFIPSEVNLVGRTVTLQGNASVRAPGAKISVNAAENPFKALTEPPATSDGGRIYLDSQSRIDASGLRDVAVDVTRNLLTVRLTSNDLQDAPLQRDGFLRGRTVVVDARTGSTLFNTAPYAGGIQHSVQEQLTRGGSITLRSTGDVITREGSVQDVSGGSIAYQGGLGVATTRLLGVDGKAYDIATAPADMQYVGFASSYSYLDQTWGVTTSVATQLMYSGYTDGADAGTLSAFAPSLYLRGLMAGQTFENPFQRDPARMALGGALVIGDIRRRTLPEPLEDLRAPSLVLVDGVTDVLGSDFDALSDALPSAFGSAAALSPQQIAAGGFSRITALSNGAITVGDALHLAAGGSFEAIGERISIDADIDIAGGTVSLTTTSKVGEGLAPHDITLGPGAQIDVSGRWTNDLAAAPGAPGTGVIVTRGGSVSLRAQDDVRLQDRSGIDVSGGAHVSAGNRLSTGRAGSISLAANEGVPIPVFDSAVHFGAGVQLRGLSFAPGQGGALSIRSGSITIGSTARGTDGELRLDEAFLETGTDGFSRYDLTGTLGLAIGLPGQSVHLSPLQQVRGFSSDLRLIASGADLDSFTTLRLPLDAQQVAVDLAFASSTSRTALGVPQPGLGDVTLAQGSSILTGPGGTVSLAARGFLGNLSVLGDITTPGGNIRLQLGAEAGGAGDYGYIDLANGGYVQQLRLGAEADLDARGVARVNTHNALGLRQGTVLDGGTVSLLANKGFIVTEAGSTIDVSATSATLDLRVGDGIVATPVTGDAGTIAIDAREGMVLGGRLAGRAADAAGSGGGTLSIGLGAVPGVPGATVGGSLYNHALTQLFNGNSPASPYPTAPRVLRVSAAPAATLPTELQSGSASLSTATLAGGGFDHLALKSGDVVEFSDTLFLRPSGSLTVDAPVLRVGDGALVKLAAARVAFGYYLNDDSATQSAVNPFRGIVNVPELGAQAGRLIIGDESTRVIDVRGSSVFENVETARLQSAGDLRLSFAGLSSNVAPYASGSLYTAGDLSLSARQVYPTSATRFDILSLGTVSIASPQGADPAVPLSAGGDLRITAHRIEQAGVLRAPLGRIELRALDQSGVNGRVTLAQGSLTSVSAEGALLPFGVTLNAQQYAYDFGVVGVTLVGPAEEGKAAIPLLAKEIRIDAAEIVIDEDPTGDRDARLDLSGGGDLYAYEFIAGPGGSKDVLDATTGRYSYAILPSLGGDTAPLDLQYLAGTNIPAGKSIVISGVPGLPDGTYTLLPARYALLPGAFAVQVVAADSDVTMQAAVGQLDGSYLTAARLATAGTGQIDSRSSTVRLTPGAVVRTQSQYNETFANAFFTESAESAGTVAPLLPADAGQLQLAATASLALGPAIDFAVGQFLTGTGSSVVTRTGAGGVVSIVAPRIAVTGPGAAALDGLLQLEADALNALGAQTLILGATRASTDAGERLEIGSAEVSLENSQTHALSGAEIILAAEDRVRLDEGSALETTGSLSGARRPLIVDGDGAVLRASAGEAVTLLRTLDGAADAELSIAAGARVVAGGSLMLDAAGSTTLAAGAEIRSPDVTLSSSGLNLGEVPDGTPGLNLTRELLEGLDAGGLRRLRLNSTGSIDLYGELQLGALSAAGAPALELLQLNAGSLGGHGAGDKILRAGRIELGNAAGVAAAGSAEGSGALELQALASAAEGSGVIALGDGNLQMQGFGDASAAPAVTLRAERELRLVGDGGLSAEIAGALSLQTPRIAADAGAAQRIDHAMGAVEVVGITPPSNVAVAEAGLGGSLTIRGASLRQAGTIELPAGVLTLEATAGDLRLEAGSTTRAAGASRLFFDVPAAAPAGRIELISRTGDVVVVTGATVDVSAAQTPDTVNRGSAGTLDVRAAQGEFIADGSLLGRASPDGDGADFSLDTGSLADFGALYARLDEGGFDGAIEARVRSGDVALGSNTAVEATRFALSADHGALRIAGRIDTSGGSVLGPNGGAVALWAGQGVDLRGAGIDTHAAAVPAGDRPGRGGDISVGTRTGAIVLDDATFHQAGSGVLADGSVDPGRHGVLSLRTPRLTQADGTPGVAITGGASASFAATRSIVIEGSREYAATRLSAEPDESSTLSIGTEGRLYTEAQAFADAAPQIVEAVFGAGAGELPVQLRAGIEVQSDQDLLLDANWDLAAWRFNGAPVNLSLRAAGDLDLSGSISDGFTANGGTPATWTFGAPGDSASYRLVAGADLGAANPMALRTATSPESDGGNLLLRAGRLVRTGTGTISLGVAEDLVLEAQTSVIYTAGAPATALADFPLPTRSASYRGPFNPAYSTGGGHVSVDVGGDILSAPSSQLTTDWMWRRGRLLPDGTIAAGQNTSWWTMFDRFEQGIATFGGGDLAVRAGGDIRNLSAVVASNGRLAGAAATTPLAENLSVNGGGQLSVHANGDILSGVFQVDWGNAWVRAGGDLDSGRIVADSNPLLTGTSRGDAAVQPIFVLGYGAGTVDVAAGGDLHLDAAVNSTSLRTLALNRSALAQNPRAYFYTLDADSRIDLVSAGGDVYIDNQRGAVTDIARDGTYEPTNIYDPANLSVYPPSVNAIALSGDVRSSGLETLPAAGAEVNLLARETLLPGMLTVHEGDPARLAGVLRPAPLLTGISGNLDTLARPATPLHQTDTDPVRLVAQTGDIDGGFVTVPKPARIVAGDDLLGLVFNGKNLRDGDVTLLMAGGDIEYSTSTNASNQLVSNNAGIEVEGPGYVEVLAGGDVNLGNSLGIISSGNLSDVRLPARGATLVVGAGFGRDAEGTQRAPAYESFADAYLAPRADGTASPYTNDLIAYMAGLLFGVEPEALDAAAALAAFRALPAALQLPLAAKVLTQELSQTGLDRSRLGTDYERGYQAIRTLFPEKDAAGTPLVYDGDVNMFFSQIKTQQGGDIRLLAPGGSVVVGLPNPPAGLRGTKVTTIAGTAFTVPAEANLGLLVLASGAIGGFAADSFIVNQSRVLTLQGGDIILWASEGDIDAGRGAKSASGAPPPVIQTDEQGNVFVNPVGAVSGSGIGQLLTKAGVEAGLVNLIAPKGDVNAGEAGIRVAGNLNIAAVRVIGADNISVSGTSSGVPVSDAGSLSGALSGANALGDAGKNATDQLSQTLSDAAADSQRLADALKPSFVTVRLFCLGDECEIR